MIDSAGYTGYDVSHSPSRSSSAIIGCALLILIYVGRIQELAAPLAYLKPAWIAIAATSLLLLVDPPRSLAGRLTDISLFRNVLLIALLCILSVPFSVWPSQSFNFVTNDYAKLLLFFFLISKIISTPRDLYIVSSSIIASGTILVIVMIMTYSGVRLSASNTYDPNDIAQLFVICMPAAFYRMTNANMLGKILLAAIMALMTLGVILTASRGGLIALIVLILYVVWTRTKMRMSAKILVLLIIAAVFIWGATGSYWERMNTIANYQDDYNMTASTGRLELWKRGLMLIITHPILGVGAGAYTTAEGLSAGDRTGWKWSEAHNAFIEIGASIGIIGLILFIRVVLTSFRSMRAIKDMTRMDPVIVSTAQSIAAGIVGYVASAIFLSSAFSSILYCLIAMAIAINKMAVTSSPQPNIAVS
jgi:O-antigen ligase